MPSPSSGNNNSQSGNNNSNRNNDKRKQKSTKKPRPSGFQGNATSSDNIYRKVITATGNQNTQYVALKTVLEVYAGRQGHQLWSQSIREMQLVPDSEFNIPRVDKEEYGEYNNEGRFDFHDARTQDDYDYAMYRFNADSKERLKHKYAYKDSG